MDVLSFAKHILAHQPEANAARLSLYHFLKHHYQGQEPLTPAVLNRYFSRVFEFPTVRENAAAFRAEIHPLLQTFLEAHGLNWSKEQIDDHLQVIEVQNLPDLYEITRHWMDSQQREGEKVRILPNNEEGLVVVRLQPNGELLIHDFDRLCAIRNGVIEPLHADYSVHYNAELEPLPNVLHRLRIQPGVIGTFTNSPGQVAGAVIRGYTFNKIEEFSESAISRLPLIFYPLKRLERFFVNRGTDPLYIELTRLLDQAIVLLREEHPEAPSLAAAAFERGQNAHQYIFTDDKILGLLLRELSQLLFQRTQPGSYQNT